MRELLCLTDLECTCWENKERTPGPQGRGWADNRMEIIEIGAVMIRVADMSVVKKFKEFVRPIKHPELTDFCKNLTHITQEDVDSADKFPEVNARFTEWVGDPDIVTFGAWGAFDEGAYKRDCELHNVQYPFTEPGFNVKEEVCKRMGWRRVGQGKAAQRLGIAWEGQAHRALDDAYMAYLCLKKVGLYKARVKMTLSTYEQSKRLVNNPEKINISNKQKFFQRNREFRAELLMSLEEKEEFENLLSKGLVPVMSMRTDIRE